MRCVKLDVDSTNRMFFIFQTLPPNLGMARLHLCLGLSSCPASGGILVATSLGARTHQGMFVLRPHTAFSFVHSLSTPRVHRRM